MLINIAWTAYAILMVTEQSFCIHFLELPGFDSDTSQEHRGFKKPLKAYTIKSAGRRIQSNGQNIPTKIVQYDEKDIIIPGREAVVQEAEDKAAEYEHEKVNTEEPTVGKNIETESFDSAAVQKNHQDKYSYFEHGFKQVRSDDNKHWQNSEVPVVRGNMGPQKIDAVAAVQAELQNRYPPEEVPPVHGVAKKVWQNTKIPLVRENMESQNIDVAVEAALQAEHQDMYPHLKNEVTPFFQRTHWQKSEVPVVSENREPENIDLEVAVQTERQKRYPTLKQEVIPVHGVKKKRWRNTEHSTTKENFEPQDIDAEETVQVEEQKVREPQNIDALVLTERKDRYPPIKQEETTSYSVERRHWLVSKKDSSSSDIPPINKDDKDATLKAKINMLVTQTVQDTDEKVKGVQDIKEAHREKAPYKIGFIVSMVKKSRDVLNELFNVAVKHRDEWKALEQLKIFELIVHTNVDTTNLVRQLVEIHVQHLNSSSSSGDETTEAARARRVVLI